MKVFLSIFVIFVSNTIQFPMFRYLSERYSPILQRRLVGSTRRYIMHMPNFIIHQTRPEILSVPTFPYYYTPSLNPTLLQPQIPDPIEKSDNEFIEPEFIDATEEPTSIKPIINTNTRDVEEVEVEKIDDNNQNKNKISDEKDHYYKFFILQGQPQFIDIEPNKDQSAVFMTQQAEPIKLFLIKGNEIVQNSENIKETTAKNERDKTIIKKNIPNLLVEDYTTTVLPIFNKGFNQLQRIKSIKSKKYVN